MKYAKFSDDFLSDFRLDDNGETLVLTDKRGFTRAVRLLPYEERSHGRWVFKDLHNGKTWYECSICGRKIHVGDKVQLSDFPFCHCGADMRGDEEE